MPVTLLAGLLLSVLVMAISLAWSAWQSTRFNQYINHTDRLQILTLKLVTYGTEASQSKSSAFTFLQDSHDQFQHHLDILLHGDANLAPSPSSVAPALHQLENKWHEYSANSILISRSEGVIRLLNEFVVAINEIMPDLIKVTDNVAEGLINNNAQKRQIYLASRQLMLGQRIATNVNRLMIGTKFSKVSAKQFTDDTKEFGEVLYGLVSGDKKLGLKRLRDEKLRDELDQLLLIYETVDILVKRIMEKGPDLFRVQETAQLLVSQSEGLISSISALSTQYKAEQQSLNNIRYFGFFMGAIVVVFLILLTFRLNKNTHIQLQLEATKNRRTEDAILRLLDEIAPVAQGDLRAQATVGEEITGAIADAINFTIEALRELVSTIDEMARDVHTSAEDTQVMALQLSRSSEKQAGQIEDVNSNVQNIAERIANVSERAVESVNIAQRAVQNAETGNLAVKETIRGMHVIVDDIRESSQRIKRLGETSQEIGDIVNLINDIAEQTNILALNAAIKASSAGQGGSTFTNVADEVQQLADRVAQSTQKIESLVTNIQLDTAKAVESMEQSTGDVLAGVKLAETAGNALTRMESVSSHLAEFISNVSQAATELNQLASQTRQAMTSIKQITQQNLAGTRQTAKLAGGLAQKAKEQIKSLEAFTLPSQEHHKKP